MENAGWKDQWDNDCIQWKYTCSEHHCVMRRKTYTTFDVRQKFSQLDVQWSSYLQVSREFDTHILDVSDSPRAQWSRDMNRCDKASAKYQDYCINTCQSGDTNRRRQEGLQKLTNCSFSLLEGRIWWLMAQICLPCSETSHGFLTA